MHESGIVELKKLYPGATVLSAWPVTDELSHPELGYVKQPWDVVAIDDFSAGQIERAGAGTAGVLGRSGVLNEILSGLTAGKV